jgi:hypothetical protein
VTDLLAERLAALEDTYDDRDWRDVRRRARPPRRTAVVAAGAAAIACVAAATVGAANGWLFTTHDRLVSATTHVSFQGQRWSIAITTGGRLRVCVHAARPGGLTIAAGCGPSSAAPLALLVGATRHIDVGGGQIWVGSALGFTRRITIVDTAGNVHSARPVAPPRGTKTPFRYWLIALDSGRAKSITVTGAHGRVIRRIVPTR